MYWTKATIQERERGYHVCYELKQNIMMQIKDEQSRTLIAEIPEKVCRTGYWNY